MKRHKVPVRFTGQHFTIDPLLIRDAIRLADIKKEELVLDIGAGLGFLTVHLLKHSENVIAVENDPYLVAKLRSKFRDQSQHLTIVGADFRTYTIPPKSFKVVANIPYGITTDILKKLLFTHLETFAGGCLVMQLEPAQKLTRGNRFNPYTAFYHTFFELELIYEVPPISFLPPPTVKSALVRLKKKACADVSIDAKQKYLDFLGFMLQSPTAPARTVLKKLFQKRQIRALSQQYRLNPDGPIYDLSPSQLSGCFREMLRVVPPPFHPKEKL
ncbi:hypothetical protein GCM10027275_39530 [Rhabdobacter roseus]|uniref:23S rRNA (Adenine-N6)-dimethyltransferase n=1 Tax=Rhabdobacter roseus TaxID=1655419 RepID=A0A840U1B7_9BACT|nr:23S ribosomal RNA methyltransferase Erm [Rhabdobacter roseus]MBB5285659.1 23S rRNA (adenine-N6)-dimethyltransferase [Rhabdobacter roseus]